MTKPAFAEWNEYKANMPPPDAEDYPEDDEPEVLPASFPVADDGCFYGVAGRFAQAACVHTEANPIGVLVHLLTWAGAYFGTDAALKIGNISAPPRLNAITVSVSGGGKGTSAGEVSALMREVDKVLMTMNVLPIQYRDGPMSTGEGLAWSVRNPSDALDKDTGLPSDQGIADKRLFILEEEFSAVLQASKRQGNTISSGIRRLWDNGCYSPMTKYVPVSVTNAHVCFVGHITYEELIRLMDEVEYTNGFANRLLWVCINRPKIVAIPRAIQRSIMDDYAMEISQCVKFAASLDKPLELDGKAIELWQRVGVKLARQGAKLSERARPQVLRIATIYALLDCSAFVKVEHIIAALHVWDYSTASLLYIFDSKNNPEEDHLYHEIKKNPEGLTQTEISVLIYQKHAKSEAINALLKSLEAQGKITRSTRPPAGGGKGKPPIVFKAVIA